MKIFPALSLRKWLALFLFAFMASAQAGENEIRQSLQSMDPDIGELGHIVKTPYAGLYEVIIKDRLFYTDAQGQYLFSGSIIETKSQRNITEQRHRQLFAIEFDKLPLNLALKRVKGNGSRRLAYFTDPNCGYCRKLEKELSVITDVTLYIFIGPIFSPASETIIRNVQCAKDPLKAWDELMLDGKAPVSASCSTKTDKVMELARKLRVNGTPNLIFGNGVQVPGYMRADQLEEYLGETGRR